MNGPQKEYPLSVRILFYPIFGEKSTVLSAIAKPWEIFGEKFAASRGEGQARLAAHISCGRTNPFENPRHQLFSLRLRRRNAMAARPAPRSAQVLDSGTAVTESVLKLWSN